MPDELANLAPTPVWKRFAAISAVPRPPGGEERLAALIAEEMEERGLEVVRDSAGNLSIRKPPSPGLEDCPVTTLQAHLDMVVQKDAGKEHDFDRDPITPVVLGDGWVGADGTTLGADNGIGVAAALAVLEMDIPTGSVDVLLTVKEEVGLKGALELDDAMIRDGALINLDSEDDGTIIVGCAGGVETFISAWLETNRVPDGWTFVELSLGGLEGGHSGVDIALRRGNAIIALAEILEKLSKKYPIRLAGFSSGSVANAIPREATAKVAAPADVDLAAAADTAASDTLVRLAKTDSAACFKLDSAKPLRGTLSVDATKALSKLLAGFPDGPFDFSDGVLQSSSNIGKADIAEGDVELVSMQRAVTAAALDSAATRVAAYAGQWNCEIKKGAAFPPWPPAKDSKLLKKTISAHEYLFGRTPRVDVIHAGLECGVIGAKRPGLDMISIGPTIKYPHSPKERVEIASVNRFWNLLLEILQR